MTFYMITDMHSWCEYTHAQRWFSIYIGKRYRTEFIIKGFRVNGSNIIIWCGFATRSMRRSFTLKPLISQIQIIL